MMPTSNVTCPNRSTEFRKTAVGYVRVSTSMQAEEGLSLDAQLAAIAAYCNAHELRLLRICTDIESGAKNDRPGLEGALKVRADVFVVLKFDRLSPLCGARFTRNGVMLLLRGSKVQKVFTPRTFAEQYIAQSEQKPSLAAIASALQKNTYPTPRGNTNWWPAQVRELLAGRFDGYYGAQTAQRDRG